jgi:hypothetical protein
VNIPGWSYLFRQIYQKIFIFVDVFLKQIPVRLEELHGLLRLSLLVHYPGQVLSRRYRPLAALQRLLVEGLRLDQIFLLIFCSLRLGIWRMSLWDWQALLGGAGRSIASYFGQVYFVNLIIVLLVSF